jgi:hypothetical protein
MKKHSTPILPGIKKPRNIPMTITLDPDLLAKLRHYAATHYDGLVSPNTIATRLLSDAITRQLPNPETHTI